MPVRLTTEILLDAFAFGALSTSFKIPALSGAVPRMIISPLPYLFLAIAHSPSISGTLVYVASDSAPFSS